MVNDIKILARGFTSCSFKHIQYISRKLNVVAHRLAGSFKHVLFLLVLSRSLSARAQLCNTVV
jgi:hypothetical protein